MEKCSSYKRNNVKCNYNAKYYYNNRFYCGYHIPLKTNRERYEINQDKKKENKKENKKQNKKDNIDLYLIKELNNLCLVNKELIELNNDLKLFLSYYKYDSNSKKLYRYLILRIHPDKNFYKDIDYEYYTKLINNHKDKISKKN